MIRKACIKDEKPIFEFLLQEPAYNLFLISDIQNFGFDQPFQEVWIDDNTAAGISGILLRYYSHFIIAGQGSFDEQGLAEIAGKHPDFKLISGKDDRIRSVNKYIPFTSIQRFYFAELRKISSTFSPKTDGEIQKAKAEDAETLFDLQKGIEEFREMGLTREVLQATLSSGTGRYYYCIREGGIISCAGSTAENPKAALIFGVCTAKEWRNRGFASLCMLSLCRELLSEGKRAYLFYNNPEAGRIYKRLGFHDIGRWSSGRM